MISNRRYIVPLGLALVLCFLIITKAQCWEMAQLLTYEISIENETTSVTLGESVVIKSILRNKSSQVVEIEDYDILQPTGVVLCVTRPDGTLLESNHTIFDYYSKSNVLHPGEYYCHYWDITTCLILLPPDLPEDAPKKGKYCIQAQYGTDTGIRSNTLVIEVLPVPEEERDAYDIYSSIITPLFICSHTLEKNYRDIIKKLETFVERFPESIYSDYVRYYLARYYIGVQEGAGINYQKGLEYLNRINQKNNKFAYDYAIKILMVLASSRSGDSLLESTVIDDFIQDLDFKNRSLTVPDMPQKNDPDFRFRLKRRILKYY